MKKDSYQERNRIARELYDAFAKDLTEVSFRIDETIGLNSTNSRTRESLRVIRADVSTLIEKSRHLREVKYELTNREKDVLAVLATGASVKEICQELFLSQPTVKTHLSAIYKKLSVTNRVAAINSAQKLGLLP